MVRPGRKSAGATEISLVRESVTLGHKRNIGSKFSSRKISTKL
jgi:hypothetical protein